MSEGRIIDYKVLSIDHAGTLERVVKDHISDGWEPHGPGHCWSSPPPEEYRVHFIQPMVKRAPLFMPGPDAPPASRLRVVTWAGSVQEQMEGLDRKAHERFLYMLDEIKKSSYQWGMKKDARGNYHYTGNFRFGTLTIWFTDVADDVTVTAIVCAPSINEHPE
jgi:hypothetical protein